MSKSVAVYWKVVVNNVNLSVYADQVDVSLEKDQIDMSGFGGAKEYIPGQEDGTISIEFYMGMGTNEPHTVLYPLYAGNSVFPMYVQPSSQVGTSSSNQLCGGSASLYSYPFSASLNEPVKATLEFKPAPNSSFTWGTVAP